MSSSKIVENCFVGDGLGSLFHTPEFFRLHDNGRGLYLELLVSGRPEACVHFTEVEPGRWWSPARGTYGAYALSPEVTPEQLADFHAAAEARLVEQGAREIELVLPPEAHDPTAFANMLYLLRRLGFAITHCDLNHSLDVTAVPLADRMTYGNRKRLNKCAREGLTARVLDVVALAAVYDTIAANRAMKGNQVSMTLEQLQEMARLFPDRVLLFGCGSGDELAASAVCLRLTERILYVFYWGDRPGYSAYSPVVALAAAIYGWCQDNGVALLDVGTSTVDVEPNYGLIQFKRGLGFRESLKVRMVKRL